MKSITEVLGGAQILLSFSFDVQDCFAETLSAEHRTFLAMLRVIEEGFTTERTLQRKRGRPPIPLDRFKKAFLALNFFRAEHVAGILRRLESDENLRRLCDFSSVPSAASFSRRMAVLAQDATMERVLNFLAENYHEGRIIGHISRDSTAIESREKPRNKKKDVALPEVHRRKRGRPRKGEKKPEKKLRRLARQLSMKPGKALAELDSSCSWGCKKNSQGNVSFWKGYKLHLDVTDVGIPVTAVLTGANVHDSQVALPMEKLTERKITHLYSVMDSAYDAPELRGYIIGKGRVPLIKGNKRRSPEFRPFTEAQRERFKVRSVVERANSQLKDYLIPAKVFVRGKAKVFFQLLCGVVCLAALKILQYFILPKLET